MTKSDASKVGAAEVADVRTYTQAEVDTMLASAGGGADPGNAARPAVEEGPHLKQADIRAAKLDLLRSTGFDPDAADLPADHPYRAMLARG